MTTAIWGQSVERHRPPEWDDLVFGGRFMDRFLPMPVMGKLTYDAWGAKNVIPRYTENGIEDDEWSYWGGNAVKGDDGAFHLFVCRWAEDSPKGHMQWAESEIVHAVSENPLGPYKVIDVVGPGHNPEIFQLHDGRYVIYCIGAYYIADILDGPWERREFEFKTRDRKIIDGLSNLTFTRREDGSVLMICRGGGVWFSETGISPYHQVTDKRVYPPVEGYFEDPVVWRTDIQYHLIVNDWLGRIAFYLRSKDGVHWKVEPGEAYLPGLAKYEDGTVVDWFKYERIKVLQNEQGRAMQTFFAVIDTLKHQDKSNDHHSSKNIAIPLTVGRQLSILNKDKITEEAKEIRVKILAEDGFNPHTDMDINSLRFGASEKVNFGRGCKIVDTEKVGDDLIMTFDGKENGLTDNNFAAKLIGKTDEGKLLFGYARLPGVDYLEPILSAREPVITTNESGFSFAVEVQNFGQVASKPTKLKISYKLGEKEVDIADERIPELKPFEKTTVELASKNLFEKGVSYDFILRIDPGSANGEILECKLTPFTERNDTNNKQKHNLFGIWKDYEGTENVEEYIKRIRKGRY